MGLLGGAFFTLHPANVQVVVWISQLKSTAGLAFALGALLALPRRPVLATTVARLALMNVFPIPPLPPPIAQTRARGDLGGSLRTDSRALVLSQLGVSVRRIDYR